MHVTSRSRLFPAASLIQRTTRTPLSVLDCNTLRYSPTAAIWIFRTSPLLEYLTASLKATLVSYPQWSGQLQWTPYDPFGNHTQRFERLEICYGSGSDPGVEFIIASTTLEISSIVPQFSNGCVEFTDFPLEEFLDSEAPLAFHDAITYVGLPCLIIQITTFASNGLAIALKSAHPLADAQSLLQFTHDWAAVNRAMVAGTRLPELCPIFDPSLLDHAATGDIDARYPSEALLGIARTLPMHRYDLWRSTMGCPPSFSSATQVPTCLLNNGASPFDDAVGRVGNPLPWDNWDATAPISHYLIEFSSRELHAMWEEACSPSNVSHLDALLAHVWSLIVRARDLGGEHHLDITFGFRNRLNPPLPSSFMGSPLNLAKVTLVSPNDSELGQLAMSIRQSLKSFDSFTLPAFLHEMAFQASSLRLWNAFFGSRNTIVTSWLQLGVRDVDFGTGISEWAQAVMPIVDGCLQVMESTQDSKRPAPLLPTRRWYDSSVVVSLHLRRDVMQRLLGDPALRKYRDCE